MLPGGGDDDPDVEALLLVADGVVLLSAELKGIPMASASSHIFVLVPVSRPHQVPSLRTTSFLGLFVGLTMMESLTRNKSKTDPYNIGQ